MTFKQHSFPLSLMPLLLILAVSLLSGCAGNDVDETENWTAEQFYNEAQAALKGQDYVSAIESLEKLEARFPFGKYAQQAQLDMAFAYYKSNDQESAIAAADRFIKLHPRHEKVDYAYYLRGVASFKMGEDSFNDFFGQDPTSRDPASVKQAFLYFSELSKRFPNSKYTKDATQRMIHLRNHLARYEVYVAEYYFNRGTYIAAANRGKYVIEHYQKTPSIADALTVMAKSYKMLGMDDLMQSTLKVLKLNHSTHPGIEEINKLTAPN